MTRKLLSLILAALTLACGSALADTAAYTDRDNTFTFEYDDSQFTVDLEDYSDDGPNSDLVLILTATDLGWGMADLQFLRMEEDFSEESRSELEQALGVTLSQGEWNGISDVYSYEFSEDGMLEQAYILRLDPDTTLTVSAVVESLDDEETGMLRDDAISAVLNSLKLLSK